MSSTSQRDRADQTNLSPSGAIDGTSMATNATLAIDSPDNRRSDNVDGRANHSSMASPVQPVQMSRRSIIMNTIVSATAVATATPMFNEDATDRGLLELGNRYDAAVRAMEDACKACGEIEHDYWKLVDGTVEGARHVEETTTVGREYSARSKRAEEAERTVDTLARAIQAAPALTVAALGVKAKVAAFNASHFWHEPKEELDWDRWGARCLIEANLAAAGLPPAEEYFEQVGLRRDDSRRDENDVLLLAAEKLDPIFAAIERHKELSVAYDADPENLSSDSLLCQANQLFFAPLVTSSAGVAALLRYISMLDVWQMPGCFSEPREVEGIKKMCAAIGGALAGYPINIIEMPASAARIDNEILRLTEEYIIAENRFLELYLSLDRIESGFKFGQGKPLPEALQWRESDAALGLEICTRPKNDCDPDNPFDVNKLREEKWTVTSMVEAGDELTISQKKVLPSPEARARADEIVAAYDAWCAPGKPPRGYRKMVRECDRARREKQRLQKDIYRMPATTAAGMLAKIRCEMAWQGAAKIKDLDFCGAADGMQSIAFDLERLAAQRRA